MSVQATNRETIGENKTTSGLPLAVPDGIRVLIVSDDADAERMKTVLREAGFVSEIARSMTAGCEAAKSGRFQVVVSTPQLTDGSWRRLIDIANHYDLGFEVVVWARNFDLHDWAQSVNDGAFDVFDALNELPRAVEVAVSSTSQSLADLRYRLRGVAEEQPEHYLDLSNVDEGSRIFHPGMSVETDPTDAQIAAQGHVLTLNGERKVSRAEKEVDSGTTESWMAALNSR